MEKPIEKNGKEKIFTTKKITVTAIMTALSYLLYMFVKFPLPFFPPWLDIQISELPAMLTGFMAGPLWGGAVIFLKCLLKLPFSSTSGVGELGDLLMGLAYVVPSALLYCRRRTKKTALFALLLGTACEIAVSLLTNGLILIPFYAKAYGWGAILNMIHSLFPNITQTGFYLYYLPLSVLPFNLLRMAVCSVLTFLLYKHLHRLIDKMFLPRVRIKSVADNGEEENAKTDGGVRTDMAAEQLLCSVQTDLPPDDDSQTDGTVQ